MLTGSLKVTPLAALSRFSNLKQEIIRMKKCKKILSISPVQAGSWGARENYNCQHAWQQQGGNSILPPKKLEKNKGNQVAAAFSPKIHSRKTSFLSFSNAVKECFSFLAPALPHAVALLKEEKAEVIFLHEGFVL